MRKSLLAILTIGLMVSCGTKNPQVSKLEKEKELFELNTKLTKLKIDYEKEKVKTNDLRNKAAASDAKQTMKVLKSTEKTNKDLASSERKLQKLENNIAKIQNRLNQLNQQVEITNKYE